MSSASPESELVLNLDVRGINFDFRREVLLPTHVINSFFRRAVLRIMILNVRYYSLHMRLILILELPQVSLHLRPKKGLYFYKKTKGNTENS